MDLSIVASIHDPEEYPLDIRQIIVTNLGFTHQMLDSSIHNLSHEELHRRVPGSRTNSLASIYAHTVFAEDTILSGLLRRTPLVYDAGGWRSRLSVAPARGLCDEDWHDQVRIHDINMFRMYAHQVYCEVDRFILGTTDSDLEILLTTPFGEQTVAWVLNNFLAWHTIQHTGELSSMRIAVTDLALAS